MGVRVADDGRRKLLECLFGERFTLHVLEANRVQDYIDALRARRDAFGVNGDCPSVQHVELRDFYFVTCRPDWLSYFLESTQGPAGQKDSRALASEYARGRTANRASTAVNDGRFAGEKPAGRRNFRGHTKDDARAGRKDTAPTARRCCLARVAALSSLRIGPICVRRT